MPIEVTQDVTRGWLVAKGSGCLTIADVLHFLKTARAGVERRLMPLLFDATGAITDMTPDDVELAVEVVSEIKRRSGTRGLVAIAADDRRLYEWLLLYEARCAMIGVRIIRVFPERSDAEQWLELLAAARYFG
jgi:hypothetical protein